MQKYIHADNPAPDEDTLLTLIETNDALATSMSRHQRALLQARRMTSTSPPQGGYYPPPGQQAGGGAQTAQTAQATRASVGGGVGGLGKGGNGPSGGGGIFTGPPPQQPSSSTTLPSTSTSTAKPPLDPFADSNEVDRSTNDKDARISPIPQNYGLPPDNVPVPGSPKGDGAAEWGRLPFREQAEKGVAGAGMGGGSGIGSGSGIGGGAGGVGAGSTVEGGEGDGRREGSKTATGAPVLQHPKPRYRF